VLFELAPKEVDRDAEVLSGGAAVDKARGHGGGSLVFAPPAIQSAICSITS
jgi:hypothetical protein